ncbi:MAG TPA: hypothetical protein VK021_01675 [Flavobacteriaceae bacterium]|nr:hypothetical protein [Flavobacteriaceae bacterium]
MRDRILKNWTIIRVFYVAIGGYTAVSAFIDSQWAFVLIGTLFGAMGIFGVGCAGGNCQTSFKPDNSKENNNKETIEVQYEEIK